MGALTRANGWFKTSFRGRQAWRHAGDWVALKSQGRWELWRDGAAGTSFFAAYGSVDTLQRDLERSSRVSREPKLMHQERRPRPPRDQDSPKGWGHDDPRWG
jgi:hypothetical protein